MVSLVVVASMEQTNNDQLYEDLHSTDAVNAAVTYAQLHPARHDVVQRHSDDGHYKEIA